MRPTYLCIEDIPDSPHQNVDIEKEQEKVLRGYLNFEQWMFLTWLEVKRANTK